MSRAVPLSQARNKGCVVGTREINRWNDMAHGGTSLETSAERC